MKIGDKVLIKGTIDEIRKDIVIIKNEGGYFGTVPSEIIEDHSGQAEEYKQFTAEIGEPKEKGLFVEGCLSKDEFDAIKPLLDEMESTLKEFRDGWLTRRTERGKSMSVTKRQSCENCKHDPKECGNDAHYGFCQNWEYSEPEPAVEWCINCRHSIKENDVIRVKCGEYPCNACDKKFSKYEPVVSKCEEVRACEK